MRIETNIRRTWATLAMIATVGFVGSAGATTFIMGPITDLRIDSDIAIRATVGPTHAVQEANGAISTLAEITVDRVLKGTAPGSLVVRLPGGRLGGQHRVVAGAPQLVPGTQTLLYLRLRPDGTYSIVDLGLGHYELVDGPRGTLAIRDLGAMAYQVRNGRLRARPGREAIRLSDLLAAMDSGVEPQAVPVGSGPIEYLSSFTLLTDPPARWNEPDEGKPIVYLTDPAAAAATGLDAVSAIRDSLAAWSAVDCATVQADLHTSSEAAAPFNSCDGQSRIIFEDPFGEIDPPHRCRGIAGVGGYCSVSEGSQFDRITEGDVLISEGFQDCPFWNEIDLGQILTHEIGHSLGLGHSSQDPAEGDSLRQDATMYFAPHLDGRGAVVMADDRNGICSLYPAPEPEDEDQDGAADQIDNCQHVANPNQGDTDGDGEGDMCDYFTWKQSTLYPGRPGVGDTKVKVSGTIKLPRNFNPGQDDLTIDLIAEGAVFYRAKVKADTWRMNRAWTSLRATHNSGKAREVVTLIARGDATYTLRVNTRGVSMNLFPDKEVALAMTAGPFSTTQQTTLRRTAAGTLVLK